VRTNVTEISARGLRVAASRRERAVTEARRRADLRGKAMTDHDKNVQEDADDLVEQLAAQEAAYVAWTEGKTHPDDPLYERIWRGQAPGVDSDKALDRLDRDRKMLAQLESGTDFQSIPGWRALGNTLDMVVHRLEVRCETYEEALRCGGKNLSVNQGHVTRARQQLGQS